jgi:hypothetical protein
LECKVPDTGAERVGGFCDTKCNIQVRPNLFPGGRASCSHGSHIVNIVRFSLFQYLPNDMHACPFIHVWKYCHALPPGNKVGHRPRRHCPCGSSCCNVQPPLESNLDLALLASHGLEGVLFLGCFRTRLKGSSRSSMV